MDNWQQRFDRTDPYPEIPFATDSYVNIDVVVSLACLVAAVLVGFFGR